MLQTASTSPHIQPLTETQWRRVADILFAAWLIARKDLAIEFRTRSAFLSAVVFSLLGLVIFYYAWDPTAVSAPDLAPGVLWVIFTFSGREIGSANGRSEEHTSELQ